MGSARAGIYQFNAYEKNVLGWLPTANLTSVTNSGTYRVTAFDAALGTARYALLIKKDTERTYWLDKRSLFTANRWETDGIEVHWGKWSQSNGGSQLIDTNPGGSNGTSDSPLLLGRTFSDTAAGVHITPVGKISSSPEAMDVVVNIGSFSGNSAPTVSMSASSTSTSVGASITLTANATDSNGDALSYFWDFGDNTNGANAASVSKSWSTTGTKTVTCKVSDMKGGVATGTITITVGTSTNKAPTVATAASASPSSVTGTTTSLKVLGADDAGESNLSYTWSASGPASVSYSSNGSNASKNSTVTFSKAGSYAFTATIKDAGGLTVTSGVNVTVNQTFTSIAVSPAQASVVTGSTQQFAATCKDQFGNALASAPSLTWTVTGGGTIGSSGLFTASTIGGPFTVTATANGISGTASVSVTAPPDTTPPTVSLNSPTNGTTVLGTIGLAASASDNIGVTKVSFYRDGSSSALATDTTSPYSANWNTTTVTNGVHSLVAKAFDAAGNVATSSTVSVTVNNPPDTIAPVVSLTAPLDGSLASGKIPVAANATDNYSVIKVEFYKDSDTTPFATDTTTPFSITFNTTTVPNGTHTLRAKAYDLAGNATMSATVSINISNDPDTTAPTVSITAPIAGATVGGKIPVTASASDNYWVTKVEFYKDSDATAFATDTSSPYSVTFNTTTLSNGTHTFKAKAYDAAGFSTVSSVVSVTVYNAPDTMAPTVSLTAPANGATVMGSIPVTASASDNYWVTKVEFYKDSDATAFATDTSSPYSVTFNTTTLSNGTHTFKAKAYDAAGFSTTSAVISVTVNNPSDTTAPTVSITSPANGASVTGTIPVTATATDNYSVTKVEFYRDSSSTPFATDTTSPYSVSLDTATLSDGNHTFTAKAYDAAGNTKISSSVSVTVSNSNGLDQMEQQVLDLVNQERAKAGLPPLVANTSLIRSAKRHTNDMATNDFVSHTGSDGSTFTQRITDAGYQYSYAGENIAAGYTTAAEVVNGWMNSSGHRANILSPNYKDIGIGHAYNSSSTYGHYWTQDFGSPR